MAKLLPLQGGEQVKRRGGMRDGGGFAGFSTHPTHLGPPLVPVRGSPSKGEDELRAAGLDFDFHREPAGRCIAAYQFVRFFDALQRKALRHHRLDSFQSHEFKRLRDFRGIYIARGM